jgi:hypothetical protein
MFTQIKNNHYHNRRLCFFLRFALSGGLFSLEKIKND